VEIDVNKQIYLVGIISSALFFAGCEGDDGTDGTNGADGSNGDDGFNSLIATRAIPKGDAVCLGGGLALDSGLDINRNDVLDQDEVTATELLECEATPMVRALHASPDAPAVNVWVNGAVALEVVDYSQGSGFVPVVEENVIAVEAITPAGNVVVIEADVNLDYNTEASYIAVNTVADGIRALPIVNASDELITDGFFRAQVVHASPSAPAVNVYVTAFDDELAGSSPVNGAGTPLAFEQYTGRLQVPAGDYQIRITVDGDETLTPVFDSGEISLPAGADLMIVAIENTGPGASPVDLVVLDGTAAAKLEDVATPASAIAVHLSPDAPPVDILADVNGTPEDEMLALVRNVPFGAYCDLNAIPAPGDYNISVVASADNSVVATEFALVVEPSTEVTAIVSGFLTEGMDPAIVPLPQIDDRRSIITETKLRVTHASPSTGLVDIYLVEAGTAIDGTFEPNFADVAFGTDTTQLSIPNDMYDAVVTAADSLEPAIELLGLDFTAGGSVLSVIARDLADGGLDPMPLIIDMTAVPACGSPEPAI
jgi:hypothetical protein